MQDRTTQAGMLRLNVAVPPSHAPNNLGVVGGDLAGFPNGRRVADDVTTVELWAIAGVTIRWSTPLSPRTWPQLELPTARPTRTCRT